MYLLDTNHCSRIIDGNSSIISKLNELDNTPVATCVIVSGELYYMVFNSRKKDENYNNMKNFLNNIEVYQVDGEVSEIYGNLKFQIFSHFGIRNKDKRKKKEKLHEIGFKENDLWIAAIAKRNDLILVTADKKDFNRIKEVMDIKTECWY